MSVNWGRDWNAGPPQSSAPPSASGTIRFPMTGGLFRVTLTFGSLGNYADNAAQSCSVSVPIRDPNGVLWAEAFFELTVQGNGYGNAPTVVSHSESVNGFGGVLESPADAGGVLYAYDSSTVSGTSWIVNVATLSMVTVPNSFPLPDLRFGNTPQWTADVLVHNQTNPVDLAGTGSYNGTSISAYVQVSVPPWLQLVPSQNDDVVHFDVAASFYGSLEFSPTVRGEPQGTIDDITWEFGDGEGLSGPFPEFNIVDHQYTTADQKSASVLLEAGDGAWSKWDLSPFIFYARRATLIDNTDSGLLCAATEGLSSVVIQFLWTATPPSPGAPGVKYFRRGERVLATLPDLRDPTLVRDGYTLYLLAQRVAMTPVQSGAFATGHEWTLHRSHDGGRTFSFMLDIWPEPFMNATLCEIKGGGAISIAIKPAVPSGYGPGAPAELWCKRTRDFADWSSEGAPPFKIANLPSGMTALNASLQIRQRALSGLSEVVITLGKSFLHYSFDAGQSWQPFNVPV